MRIFNHGRWLETEVKLADGENSISWGFALGEFRTTTVLRINDKGEWTELEQLTIGELPPQKMMNLRARFAEGTGGHDGCPVLLYRPISSVDLTDTQQCP